LDAQKVDFSFTCFQICSIIYFKNYKMMVKNLRLTMRSTRRFTEANFIKDMPVNWDKGNLLELSKQKWIKKSMLLVGLFIFTSVVLKAQSPQKINFQSIVRNTNGVIVSNKSVNFKITILSGTITGTSVYSETHLKTTDAIGLVSLQIGTGTVVSGVFSSIDWGNALHFIKLEADFSGGNTYVTLGTQELMSVPYAMYAAKTDTASLNLTNRFAEKAPVYNPTFTGSVSGIDKNMVGLSDVNNTSDMDKPVSSLTQAALDAKVNIADTSNMLSNYLTGINAKVNIADTSNMLSNYLTGINAKVNIADTSNMLSNYLTGINAKVNTSDTSSMLSKYLRKADFPSGTSVGEFMYWNGSKWVSLSPGTTGQVLTMSSNGTPTWGCLITNSAGTPSSSSPLSVNTALTSPITIATTGATGIDTTGSGLPNGVTAIWSANVITISGTPTNTGTFNYTIPLTGGCGTASATGTITVNATVPGPPTGVVATAGNASAEVAFVAPTNNGGSPIAGYTVTSNPAGGTGGTGSGSPLTVTGLTNGTSYTFTVVATNTVGSSASSDPSTAVTPATAPDAPTGVVATAGNASASVAFVAPTNNGGSAIVEYLVTSNPATSLVKGNSSPINVTGLTNGTSYSFIVQAVNGVDTSASSTPSTAVTPNASACPTTSITYNGYDYKTVGIGTQCWMAENLRTRKYNDGTDIPFDASGGTTGGGGFFIIQTWGALTSGAHTLYAHDSISSPSNLTSYGYLYNWYAVNDSRKLCPTGWHVPTDEEWTTLTTFLGGVAVAGGKMKSMGTTYWNSPNTDADNSSGFSALPGGYRDDLGSFSGIRNYAFFWSATNSVGGSAFYRRLASHNGNVERSGRSKSVGASVRCLKD
jgi:uncharacterized protein (TIGR02145 family)